MKLPSFRSRTTLLYLLFYTVLTAAVFPILLRQIHANDLFKALYSGRYLARFHQFPHHSTFTYSPVKDFLIRDAFNWLGNLTFIQLYHWIGLTGLQLVRVLVGGGALVVFHARTKFAKNPLVLLILILTAFGISQKLRLRTAIVAIPFTILLVLLWTRYDLDSENRYLYALIPLFVIWSNMHGSYVVGLGLFFVLVISQWGSQLYRWFLQQDSLRQSSVHLLIVTVLIVGSVTFVKPFPDYKVTSALGNLPYRAVSLVQSPNEKNTSSRKQEGVLEAVKTFLQETIRPSKGFRSNEFASPLKHTKPAFARANFILAPLLIFLILSSRLPRRYIPIILVTVILGLAFLRSIAYIPLVLGTLAVESYRRELLSPRVNFASIQWTAAILAVGLTAFILVYSSMGLNNLTNQTYHRFGFGTIERFSENVPNYVLQNYPEKPVANSFNTGAYLIWTWWPHKKVLADSKTTAYTQRFWKIINRVGILPLITEHEIRLFILEEVNPNVRLLNQNPNWKIDRAKKGLVLFRHSLGPGQIFNQE